jgi:WS/DGAT/MGAT family acyltransferase
MSDRVASSDLTFVHLESRTSPQHVGSLAIFEPPAGGFDYQRLVALLEERIALAPRFRQRLRSVPAGLGNPIWIDDPSFDLTFHVRRTALPRPGSAESLLAFAELVQSRLLNRARPLWEMYFVEGLPGDRFAVLTKTHPSLVDGSTAVDLASVLLDDAPHPRRTVAPLWMPEPEPDGWTLAWSSVRDLVLRPVLFADAVRGSIADARSTASWAADAAHSLIRPVVAGRRRSALPTTPRPSAQRRLAAARVALEDLRRVHAATGASVNDVLLAVVAGALRRWLLDRNDGVVTGEVRALVPLAVPSEGGAATGRVVATLVVLPVGEPDARRRLKRICEQTAALVAARPSIGADVLVALSDFAPPTMHALGARAAAGLTGRLYDLPVVNVPGPQRPRYAAGARMVEIYPLPPLAAGKPLAVGITSYDGDVFVGLTADRDAVPDTAALASALPAALAELAAAVPAPRPNRRRVARPAASAGGSG